MNKASPSKSHHDVIDYWILIKDSKHISPKKDKKSERKKISQYEYWKSEDNRAMSSNPCMKIISNLEFYTNRCKGRKKTFSDMWGLKLTP